MRYRGGGGGANFLMKFMFYLKDNILPSFASARPPGPAMRPQLGQGSHPKL